jgi:cation:H+ antiporter
VLAAFSLTLPWVGISVVDTGLLSSLGVTSAQFGTAALSTLQIVTISGVAVLGASFLLAWAAETAEKDVPRAFALAVLAVLAVAPEYAVDALYAWEAGQNPGSNAASLAVANMTGANRILIGLGWSGIALYTIYRVASTGDSSVDRSEGFLKSKVNLSEDIPTEIFFLFLATLYAFTVPLGGGIGMVDVVVLVGLYVAYIYAALNGPEGHDEQVGVPAYLQDQSKLGRVVTVLGLFGFAGAMILLAVEPFAHGLESLGTQAGVDPFLMIQWVAPLASESPELIVVAYLVNKARATAGFNALISSKLNQWTLLIGTISVVYSISLGSVSALPLSAEQNGEIWLTAAQSFFALAILVNFDISVREAIALLVLFVSQVALSVTLVQEGVLDQLLVLHSYTAAYILLGVALLIVRRDALARLVELTRLQVFEGVDTGGDRPAKTAAAEDD